jgi:hypothetical protein|tara:strand:+ start:36 stop:464 length:429 start_codon:yes stop_codon:yes gene_type:complete
LQKETILLIIEENHLETVIPIQVITLNIGDLIMGWLGDFIHGFRESQREYMNSSDFYASRNTNHLSSSKEENLNILQQDMRRIGSSASPLPPQVRLAMFNASRPPDQQVKLTGSGMSMTRQMDVWDSMGTPYGGGYNTYDPC